MTSLRNHSFGYPYMFYVLIVLGIAVRFTGYEIANASDELIELPVLETLEAAEKELQSRRISRSTTLLNKIQGESSLRPNELVRFVDLKSELLLRKEEPEAAESLNNRLSVILNENMDALGSTVVDSFRQRFFTRKAEILEHQLGLSWSAGSPRHSPLLPHEKDKTILAIEAYRTALKIPEGIRSKDQWWEVNTLCSLVRLMNSVEHPDLHSVFEQAMNLVFKQIRDTQIESRLGHSAILAFKWISRLCSDPNQAGDGVRRLKTLAAELESSNAIKVSYEVACLRLTISDLEFQIGNVDSAWAILRIAEVDDSSKELEKAIIKGQKLALEWKHGHEKSNDAATATEWANAVQQAVKSTDHLDGTSELELAFEYVDACKTLQQICLDAGMGRLGLMLAESLYAFEKKLKSENTLTQARFYLVKATHLARLRETVEASELFTGALECFPSSKQSTLEYGIASNNAASVCLARADWNSAKQLLTNARKIMLDKLDLNDFRMAELYCNEGLLSASQADFATGATRYANAIEICERNKVDSSNNATQKIFFINLLLNSAQLERSQGRDMVSDALAERARRLLRSVPTSIEQTLTCRLLMATFDLARAKRLKDMAEKRTCLSFAEELLKEITAREGLSIETYAASHYLLGLVGYHLHSLGIPASLKDAEEHWDTALRMAKSKGLVLLEARILLQWLRAMIENTKNFEGREVLAQEMADRLSQIQEKISAFPGLQFAALETNALLKRRIGQRAESRRLLEKAISVAKSPRNTILGNDLERAEYWSRYASGFDRLVEWTIFDSENSDQELLGNAIRISDSKRSLTYLDQLRAKGLRLEERIERDAPDLLKQRKKLSSELLQILEFVRTSDGTQNFGQLGNRMEEIHSQRVTLERQIQEVCNVYRTQTHLALEQEKSVDVRDLMLRDDATKNINTCIYYHLGVRTSFTILVRRLGEENDITISAYANEVSDEQAQLLGISAGELGEASACTIVNKVINLLTQTKDLTVVQKMILKSATEVFLPPQIQALLCESPSALTLVVPDGPLHRLPFDSLVVDGPNGEGPIFLLDHPRCPAFFYCPSLAIYTEINGQSSASEQWNVVTVGNPRYAEWNRILSRLPVSSEAFPIVSSELPDLKGSAVESDEIKKHLTKLQRVKGVHQLIQDDANELSVTAAIEEAEIIHIAAHGAVNESFENLFGGIVLSPGLTTSNLESNDGVLTLLEIGSLELDRCQLAILSACKTNCGPERPLEAGSTLSRAFITAGAKRVICSQWNLDDASTAFTISSFAETFSHALDKADSINYPNILLEAKRECRKRFPHPRNWAPLVLVGIE